MADESLANLTRFYHEFIRPDTERVLEGLDTVTQRMEAFENRTLLHFDEIYKRLDDLKKEYDALTQGSNAWNSTFTTVTVR